MSHGVSTEAKFNAISPTPSADLGIAVWDGGGGGECSEAAMY